LRTDEVPKRLPVACLENLAFICEKYDCTGALMPWTATWLKEEMGDLEAIDLKKTLFAV